MADSSQKDLSSKGLFFNRSLLWKIVVVFILIILLSIFQFFVMFGSISSIQDQTDESFSSISSQNNDTFVLINTEIDSAFSDIEQLNTEADIQREINNGIANINDKLLKIQTFYLGYVSDTNGNAEIQYLFTVPVLTEDISELQTRVSGVTNQDVDPETGLSIVNLIASSKDEFVLLGEDVFNSLPRVLGIEIQKSFTNFSNAVNFKMTNLLQWMYSGNDSILLNNIISEFNADSSFANNINSTLIPISGTSPALFSDLLDFSGDINLQYTNFIVAVQNVIDAVNAANNDPTLFNQGVLNTAIDSIVTFTTQINNITNVVVDLIDEQESTLEDLLFDVSSSYSLLTTLMAGLSAWSEDASTIISDSVIEVRINAQQDLEGAVDNSTIDLVNIIDKTNKNLEDIFSSTRNLLVIILLVSTLIIIGFVGLAYYQISKPIKHISYWSEKISDGDLSYNDYRSQRLDEIGVLHNNFRLMNKNLKDIIIEVKDSSSVISETADDLSSNTQEINATAEEVSAIAQSMAKGSTQQAELISTIVEELQITSEIVDHVISQINYNLRIIHELSEQTNVLALNTAIEAANAGEFGRGFAVISESIRKMASQSKKTTEEVTKDSREVLLQLQTTFSNITEKIETVAAVSEETAASAEEVAASAEELTSVMETVSAKSAMLNDRSSQSAYLVSHFVLERQENTIKKDDLEENGNGEEPAKSEE